jgi:hypothetical protein
MMWGGTAFTSLLRAGGWPTPAPPGGLRRGCVGTSGATPRRPQGASGPTPPTSWRAQGVGRWRSHGRRGCTKHTGRPTPRGHPPRGREASPPATRVVHPPQRGLRAGPPRRLAGMNAPSPAAEAQAQSQDVGRGERRRPRCARGIRRICPRVLSRRIRVCRPPLPRRLGIFAGPDLQMLLYRGG